MSPSDNLYGAFYPERKNTMGSLSMEKWVNSPQITVFIVYQRKCGRGGRDGGGERWSEEDDTQVVRKLCKSVVTTSSLLLQSHCAHIVACGVWLWACCFQKASLIIPLFLLFSSPSPPSPSLSLSPSVASSERGLIYDICLSWIGLWTSLVAYGNASPVFSPCIVHLVCGMKL